MLTAFQIIQYGASMPWVDSVSAKLPISIRYKRRCSPRFSPVRGQPRPRLVSPAPPVASIYESWANLKPETWTHVKIELHGRSARLFLNGSDSPSLVINGLKGAPISRAELRSGVMLARSRTFRISVSHPPVRFPSGTAAKLPGSGMLW